MWKIGVEKVWLRFSGSPAGPGPHTDGFIQCQVIMYFMYLMSISLAFPVFIVLLVAMPIDTSYIVLW